MSSPIVTIKTICVAATLRGGTCRLVDRHLGGRYLFRFYQAGGANYRDMESIGQYSGFWYVVERLVLFGLTAS